MRVAVIDIGSNAIRAAIYDDNTLGAAEIFNEKFRSDLVSLLDLQTLDVKHSTYNVFNYFLNIFSKLEVSNITCVATEVLRNHNRANEFIEEISKRFGIKIRILSGEEEAKLTAEGLISGIPDADGIAADLGGGSLELAEVNRRIVDDVVSIPVGTKVLGNLESVSEEYITKILKEKFEAKEYENLYLIGGALRLLGRCYMDYSRSPVKTLHNLIVKPDEFLDFLNKLESLQKFQRFFKQYKINKNAIFVASSLIKYFSTKNLIISTFGLKEGVRFNSLPEDEKTKDICLERLIEYCKNSSINLNMSSYVDLFTRTGFELEKQQINLIKMALILSQFTRNIDRNYKGEWLVNFILSTDIPFNQFQRGSLAKILSHATQTKILNQRITRGILSKKEIAFANSVGAFIKISLLIDGPVLTNPSFNIVLNDRFLDISTEKALPKGIFDKVCEQLKVIGISRRIFKNSIQD
jgi:exopolyphosphatase/guanosine-5'-triphosphate,3'-diphosphate pyrophosphatase